MMMNRTLALAMLLAAAVAFFLFSKFALWPGDEGSAAPLAVAHAPARMLPASAPGASGVAGASGIAGASGVAGALSGAAAVVPASAPVAAASPAESAGAETESRNCEASYPGCPCPGDLATLRKTLAFTPPAGLKLTDGSCTMWHGSISMGQFSFAGEATVNGTVTYESGEMWDFLTFGAEYNKRDKSPASAIHLRMNKRDPRLHLPELSEKNPCWAAPATIKIKSFQILIGDSDEAGESLGDFELLNLGKYQKCGKPNAAPGEGK